MTTSAVRLPVQAIAVLADHFSGSVDAGRGVATAAVAAVDRRCPAAQTQRCAVVEAGHRHPPATAAAALFGDVGVTAVAAEADAAFGAARGDAGVFAAASSAGSQIRPDRAHLTEPTRRARPRQVTDFAASGAARPHHGGVPGGEQCVGQADDDPRATRVTGGKRIRVCRQVGGQLVQRNSLVGLRNRQDRRDIIVTQGGQRGPQRGRHYRAGGESVLGALPVAGSAHRPSGRRITVRRTCGAGLPLSPALLLTFPVTSRISIRSLGWQVRMSHNAARVSIDSLCGGWVTSRNTCSRDSTTPRAASSDTRSEVWKLPFSGHCQLEQSEGDFRRFT